MGSPTSKARYYIDDLRAIYAHAGAGEFAAQDIQEINGRSQMEKAALMRRLYHRGFLIKCGINSRKTTNWKLTTPSIEKILDPKVVQV